MCSEKKRNRHLQNEAHMGGCARTNQKGNWSKEEVRISILNSLISFNLLIMSVGLAIARSSEETRRQELEENSRRFARQNRCLVSAPLVESSQPKLDQGTLD